MTPPPLWTVTGLLDYFQETDATPDRRFAFILGAGASVQSGIPMAGHLVDSWLRELHAREDHQRRPLAAWATAATLGIPGFDYARAVESYPQVFARRFAGRPDEGHAYLERILAGKDPSFGYSVLAQILANTRHRVVITTNFDNLVADALAIYTHQLPLVCGHESLAGFVRPNPRRPLVVKIHRDLLLAPMNTSEEIDAMSDPLAASLRGLLANFTPIVLGYGGNDGSLMGLLRHTLQKGDIPGGIYWCYWAGGGTPPTPVLDAIERHGGALIPIAGFDELMVQLNHRLGYPRMDQRIEQRASERAQRYRHSFEALQARILPSETTLADDDESIESSAPPEAPRAAAPLPLSRTTSPASPASPARATSPTRSGASNPTPSDRSDALRSATPTRAHHEHDEPREHLAPSPTGRDTQPSAAPSDLQEAVQALASDAPTDGDWWTLKLQADQQPTPWTRVAAYRDASLKFPTRLELRRALACELALANERREAREILRDLERDAPHDPQVHLDLAVLFVQWGEAPSHAEAHASRAWYLACAPPREASILAAVAFVRGLLARRIDRDDTIALRVLRGLLPVRTTALHPLAPIITRIIRNHLDDPSQQLYYRLLACLQGKADVSTLQAIDRWTALVPLPPEAAWPDEASPADPPSAGPETSLS